MLMFQSVSIFFVFIANFRLTDKIGKLNEIKNLILEINNENSIRIGE